MNRGDAAPHAASGADTAAFVATDELNSWIGRTESLLDIAAAAPLAGLAALLDRPCALGNSGVVPPLGHWLYFLPHIAQSQLGPDGHPVKGGFLPPVPLPRRMWAGGRLQFESAIPIGAAIERRSTIADISAKSGRSGAMVFVTVRHEIWVEGRCALREEQDIVYRDAANPGSAPAPTASTADSPAPRQSQCTRQFHPDPIQLFRFSALTFNAHRIHYDRDYACRVEGYGGLVVHGPLTAMLLLQHFVDMQPQAHVASFSFRALRPLLDTAAFNLCMVQEPAGASLWTENADRQVTMTATLRS